MRKRALGLAVALVVGAFVVSASGAATTNAQKVTRIDVSTRASVVHYLRSIHVNAKHAVIQRGLRNYAGARCPGKGWTCASTKHTVVQIAKQGGLNRFVCKSSKCAVVQISGSAHGVYLSRRQVASASGSGPKPPPQPGNTGYCVKTTGLTQSCTITQNDNNGPNMAGIYENAGKQQGLTQTAVYTASITQQSSGTFGNTACVTQLINMDGSTTALKGKPVSVNLKAHQSVYIQQDALGSGPNNANQPAATTGHCTSGPVIPQQVGSPNPTGLTQSQILTSSANGTATITQNLDRNDPTVPDTTNFPCPLVPAIDSPANLCIDVEQNQHGGNSTGSGANGAVFWQENDLTALANTAAGGTINQTQGAIDKGVGGLWANVNQQSSGTSTFTSTQNEVQCEDAFKNQTLPVPTDPTKCDTGTPGHPDLDPPSGVTVNQAQYGPAGMGSPTKSGNGPVHYYHGGKDPDTSSQTGGTGNNTYQINQNTTQSNDNNQVQKNFLIGGLISSGNGSVNQNALIQGSGKEDVQTGTGLVTSQIECTGSDKSTCTKTLSKPVINPTSEPDNPSFTPGSADFIFTNADPTVTFYCALTTGSGTPNYVPCDTPGPGGSGSTSYSDLAPGTYTFHVQTVDPDITYGDPGSQGPSATFTWTVSPLAISAFPGNQAYTGDAVIGTDGSSAGWQCKPGGPIALTVGTDPGTFGAISITDAGSPAISAMQEPTFASDNFATGSPRYVIDLSDGQTLFGYPPISGLNGSAMAWEEFTTNPGVYVPWSTVVADEGTATVVDAYVVADAGQAPPYTAAPETDSITNLTFNGQTYNSGTCP